MKPIVHFIHKNIGTILHFGDIPELSQKVFCDPNSLLECVNELVIKAFVNNPSYLTLARKILTKDEISKRMIEDVVAHTSLSNEIIAKEVIRPSSALQNSHHPS